MKHITSLAILLLVISTVSSLDAAGQPFDSVAITAKVKGNAHKLSKKYPGMRIIVRIHGCPRGAAIVAADHSAIVVPSAALTPDAKGNIAGHVLASDNGLVCNGRSRPKYYTAQLVDGNGNTVGSEHPFKAKHGKTVNLVKVLR